MFRIRTWLLATIVATLVPAVTPSAVRADPVGGPKTTIDEVKKYDTDRWSVRLRGDESTRIRLSGDGDTCLELRVYDPDGRLVASDTLGLGDDRVVFVRPRETGVYTVKITNVGRVSNMYVLGID